MNKIRMMYLKAIWIKLLNDLCEVYKIPRKILSPKIINSIQFSIKNQRHIKAVFIGGKTYIKPKVQKWFPVPCDGSLYIGAKVRHCNHGSGKIKRIEDFALFGKEYFVVFNDAYCMWFPPNQLIKE